MSASPTPPSSPSGAEGPVRIGRYTLIQPLGEGGMAKVHIAQKDGATDICVLKQLHLQLEQNSEAASRFHREANIASQLQHPNIAQVSDAGMEDGRFCIAMEFIGGQTVEDMVREARSRGGILPLEISVPIVLQTLLALQYAHEMKDPEGRHLGLVHRDLSPRNIMLDYGGQVKVIDFGIAKGDVDEFKTAVGSLMGTPYYMSPEQARAVPVDRRSDIYTLGTVFFEMLTGKRLVRAKGRAKILMTVARQLAPPVSSVNPNIPPEFDAVVAKALAKDPEDRFSTADEFAEALHAIAGQRATAGQELLGPFLRELFPGGEAKAHAIEALSTDDAPAVEATRVAMESADGLVSPIDLAASADIQLKTRTGYVGAENLGPGASQPRAMDVAPIDPGFAAQLPLDPAATATGSLVGQIPPGASPSGAQAWGGLTDPLPSVGTDLRPRRSAFTFVAPAVLFALVAILGYVGSEFWSKRSRPVPLAKLNPKATAPKIQPRAEIKVQVEAVARPTTPQSPPTKSARRPSKRVERKTVAPSTPPPSLGKPPPPNKPAPQKYGALHRKLRSIRSSQDKAQAMQLADQIKKKAKALPRSNEMRMRIISEADSVFRTSDLDAMLEALSRALKDLSASS